MSKLSRRTILFADVASPLLALAMAAVGVWMGRGSGPLAVSLCALFLLVAAMALGLVSHKAGAAIVCCACALYAALGVALGWSVPGDWAVFTAGALAAYALSQGLTRRLDSIRREREHQYIVDERDALVDERLQLRTLRSYQNDAMIYIRIAVRNRLSLGLVLWRLDNAAELRAALGDDAFWKLEMDITRLLRDSLRYEDTIFLIEDAPGRVTWGTLHIANSVEVCEIVTRRVKPRLAELDGARLAFSTRFAIADENSTPMSLLDRAKA